MRAETWDLDRMLSAHSSRGERACWAPGRHVLASWRGIEERMYILCALSYLSPVSRLKSQQSIALCDWGGVVIGVA
jgi:hypothetical protein